MKRHLVLLTFLAVFAACDDEGPAGPTPPQGALRFSRLEVGYLHACGLTASGGVWCWGGNLTGALGTGVPGPSSRPVRVASARDFIDLDVGSAHGCALDETLITYCWGHNDEGQLGAGGQVPSPVPVEVAGDHEFVDITVGHAHGCGLTADGVAWCWGDDVQGQLGNGEDGPQRSSVPVRVEFDEPFAEVKAGYYQTCGLTEAGAAYCWGWNYVGQNGDGTFESRHEPVAVLGGHTFSTLALGDGIACGLSGSDLWCWGSNRFFEHATEPVSVAQEPVSIDIGDIEQVAPAIGAETIGGSRPYVCAVRGDDRATCWGGAIPNVRDNGPNTALLDADMRFRMLASGPQFVCGLRTDGYAYCAGANYTGELGTGDEVPREEMTPVAAP